MCIFLIHILIIGKLSLVLISSPCTKKDKLKDSRKVIDELFKTDLSYDYSYHGKLMMCVLLNLPKQISRCDMVKSTNRDFLHSREGHNVLQCLEID